MLGTEQPCQARRYVLAPRWSKRSRIFSPLKWSRSVVSDSLTTLWTVALQAPPSMGFSRQECWSGLPFQGIFLTQGLNSGLPHCGQTLYHLSHQGISPLRSHLFRKQALPIWNQCVQGNLGNYILDHRVQIKKCYRNSERGEEGVKHDEGLKLDWKSSCWDSAKSQDLAENGLCDNLETGELEENAGGREGPVGQVWWER